MGVVYLAQLPGGPRVALKVIRRDIVGDDEGRLRLAREVNSLRLIRSDRIAEIVDADPWGPVPFVATRYVPGLSLHDYVREEGPITGLDLNWFASCLARAIEAVHAAGVVHRDIKPANVVMEGRSPVLIDFGLARLADDPRLTVTGWLLGTPGYLAPEVLYGEEATSATDVHSWAATVTFAGTGLPPYGTGPVEAVTDRVRRGQHSLTGLPDGMKQLVARCLAVDPTDRPTLAQVKAELNDLAGSADSSVPGTAMPGSAADTTMPLTASAGPDGVPTEPLAELTTPPSEPTAPLTEAAPVTVPTDTLALGTQPTSLEPPPPTLIEPAPVPLPVDEPAATQAPRLGWGHRLRLGLLALAALSAVGLWMAAYPYLTLAAGCLAIWLLRGMWHSGSAHRSRRERRGTKWYDVPHTVLSTPVHLFTSIPGSLMLIVWAGGIGLASGLIAFAFALGPAETLALMGAFTTVSAWWGPGGAEVRGVLRPITLRASRGWFGWLIALALLVALAGLAWLSLRNNGIDWSPALQGPLASIGGAVRLPAWLR